MLIARARMARPLLLVLDEPCAGMDPGVRERFLAWLNERLIQPETPTVVLVTHHIEEIVPGIQNTLILSGGRVRVAGRTQDVVTREIDRIGLQARGSSASKRAAAGYGRFGVSRCREPSGTTTGCAGSTLCAALLADRALYTA